MSGSKTFTKEFIRDLAKLLSESDLTEIELQEGEAKLRLARQIAQTTYVAAPPLAPAAPSANPAPAAPAPVAETPPSDNANTVKSPMVGTVYLASEPGAPAFIQVGDNVKEGQTLLIVEAMKVMNNIPAPRAGKVTKILVSDKEPTEFGQPLVVIE